MGLLIFESNMGGVRTKTIKRSSKLIVEKYYPRLTLDFQTNKKICDEVAIVPSKRMRNKIAGYVTRLMTRIQKGPVRGISIKLQEEERERRENYIPDVSAVPTEIDIDPDTRDMLKNMNMAHLPGVRVQALIGQGGAYNMRAGGARAVDRRARQRQEKK